eukprot:Skav228498  [mRNA]  locus=scaffold1092:338145:344721:- [translate_table: standard]
MRRWILHAHSLLQLAIADACDSCAMQRLDQDIFQALDSEDDAGSLQLLQVARVASALKPSVEKTTLEVSSNSTASLFEALPVSWLQETMRSAMSGRTMTPLLILVGLALALGVVILLLLQRLESKKGSHRRGILRAFCDGERVYGTSKSSKSLPEDYAQLFERRSFDPKNGRWSYPGMGASFTPGPKAATAELLVSKSASTA